MTKKFNRKRSLDEGEIILEEVSTSVETVELTETFPTENLNDVEITLSTNAAIEIQSPDTPTTDEIVFSKGFTGIPTSVGDSSLQIAESCVSKKLLAKHGFEFARGSQWFKFCK